MALTSAPGTLPTLADSLFLHPEKVAQPLGSFWTETYHRKEQVYAIAGARGVLYQQAMHDVLEMEESISYRTTPIFHKRLWHPIKVRQSERNTSRVTVPRYGDGTVYGFQEDGSSRAYGQATFDVNSIFPALDDLAAVQLITDRTDSPNMVWVNGLDFILDPKLHTIAFRLNPFSITTLTPDPVFEDGEIVDREITLWMYHAEFDRDDLYIQHGYVVGSKAKSSAAYRDLLTGLYDAIVGGTAMADVYRLLSGAFDIPLASQDGVVEEIFNDGDNLVIVTDQDVYKFSVSATAIVAVGDSIATNAPLISGLRIYDLNRAQIPDLTGLALGPSFMGNRYASEIGFQNQDVAVSVETVSGKTKMSFSLTGLPTDVDAFWDEVHTRGIDRGATLAELMDTRTTKIGQPVASNLPATINPMEFLIENVLRFNAFIIYVEVASIGSHAVRLSPIRTLRRILPPHVAVLFVVQLSPIVDGVTMDEPSDELDILPAAEPVVDGYDGDAAAGEFISARLISGLCQ